MMLNLGFLFLYAGIGITALAWVLGGAWLTPGLLLALGCFAVSIALGVWRAVVLLDRRG